MKTSLRFLCLLYIGALFLQSVPAAQTATNQTGFRLTVELRDGSRILGKSDAEKFQFSSEVLGDIKLPLERIRSIECAPKTNSARVTSANGDLLVVQFAMKEIRVETTFGNVRLPVNQIHRISVSHYRGHGPVGRGLVALWPGEGSGDDVAGGNNATLVGDVSFTEGKVAQAFSLDGSSACLRIPAAQSLDVGSGDGLTITAWINPSSVKAFRPILEWNTGTAIGLQLWIGQYPGDAGVLHGEVTDVNGNNHPLITSPGTVVTGRFQHVAMTYDKASGEGVLYLNGTVVARGQWGSFTPQTTGDLWISRRPTDHPGDWTYNAFFAGLLDEVAIYNRALSASEVQTICVEENNDEVLPAPQSIERPKSSRSLILNR